MSHHDAVIHARSRLSLVARALILRIRGRIHYLERCVTPSAVGPWNLGWDEWLETLHPAKREEAVALKSTFRELGAANPEIWARSQVDEGIPQLARFVLMRGLWKAIDARAESDALDSHPQAARLIAAGGNRDDVVFLARVSAFDAIMDVISLFDNGPDDDHAGRLPGWRLVEVDQDDRPTGHTVDALHEGFTSVDPSGRDAEDLLYE